MSTIVMAACWPLQMSPTAKAVLVSLADQANDQGACWPAVATLCERTCLGERAVRNALRWLEGQALLETDKRRKRDGSMNSNLYTLSLEACRALQARQEKEAAQAEAARCGVASRGDDRAPAAEAVAATGTSCPTPPAPDAAGHRHVVPHPPARGAPPPGTTCPLTVIEPTLEPIPPQPPKRGAGSAGLIGLSAMLALCKDQGEQAIPADDPVFTYAEEVGIGRDLLRLHWTEFKRRRLEGGKRQRGVDGWRRAFRNSVRDNWYRLWFIRPGEQAQLTTVGLQAQAVLLAAEAAKQAGAQGADAGGADDEGRAHV
jgi:hypothetical protein